MHCNGWGKWSWWQCWGHWGLEGQYHHLVRLLHHCHHAVNCHRPDASGRRLFNKTWRGLNGRRMRRIKFDGDNRSLCKNIFCLFVPKHDFDILLAVSKALGFFLLQRHVWPEFTCLTKICWAVQTIHVTWIVSQREEYIWPMLADTTGSSDMRNEITMVFSMAGQKDFLWPIIWVPYVTSCTQNSLLWHDNFQKLTQLNNLQKKYNAHQGSCNLQKWQLTQCDNLHK